MGPLTIHVRERSKPWLDSFTYLSTIAVYLAIVVDLSANSFLNILRISRCRTSKNILINPLRFGWRIRSCVEPPTSRPIFTTILRFGRYKVEIHNWLDGFGESSIDLIKHCFRKCKGKLILNQKS